MQTSEYKNIYINESSHFYYVGYHLMLMSLLERFLARKNGLKILDAGCGPGLFSKKLEKYGHVTALDASNEALRYAKKRGLKTVKAEITCLPFKNNTFDLVVSLDVLCHRSIKNDADVLREFNRVLKPQGILILKLPAFSWLMNSHDRLVYTKRRYTSKQLLAKLTTSGFNLQFSTYIASFLLLPVLIKSFLEFLAETKPKSSVERVWPPLNKLLICLFLLETYLIKYTSLPFGISVVTVSYKKYKSNLGN